MPCFIGETEKENGMSELSTVLAAAENDALAVAQKGWSVVEGVLVGLEPEAKAILNSLIAVVAKDFTPGGSLDDLTTALLNTAESSGHTFVVNLGSNVLQALLAAAVAAI